MRKSELATLLLSLPALLGFALAWQVSNFSQGHMPTVAAVSAVLLQIAGLQILRFIVPVYALSLLICGIRQRNLDVRAQIHLAAIIGLSLVAWLVLAIPE